ncbi:MAG: hypothetical protein ABS84_15155 [Rubrivivax sp. SCN 71-131]|jgi:hypothetical protein|nr:MAG: hypothetical protein ABS84_15155 [Rubrivivax sp. SCN 71-131]
MAMILKTVGPGRGALWVRDGLQLYMKRPMAFTGLFALFLLLALFAALLPWVGGLLQMMMVPLLSLGFMVASQSALLDGPVRATQFFDPILTAAPAQRRALLALCVLYGLTVAAVLWLTDWVADGGYTHLFELMRQDPTPLHEIDALFVERSMAAGALVGTTALTLVTIPFWHAPALVHWAHQGALQALFSSTLAVWRCRGAFVVYALTWFTLMLTLGVLSALLFGLLGLAQLGSVLALPLGLFLSTLFYVSLIFTFNDSFGHQGQLPEIEVTRSA